MGAGTWSPSSVRAFMVSPTWGAYLSYSISAGLRCPFSWDWEMGLLCVRVISSNTLSFNLPPGANHMQTRASFLEFPDIPWLRPISGSDWISDSLGGEGLQTVQGPFYAQGTYLHHRLRHKGWTIISLQGSWDPQPGDYIF